MTTTAELPLFFCWTRFGTEAGQSTDYILRRKEEERRANNGVFLWGIGNAVGSAIGELARRCEAPEVLFSPIKCSAKAADASPELVVAWTRGETSDGREFLLPDYSLVTSRSDLSSPKVSHYALVCYSANPLQLSDAPPKLSFGELRNLISGNRVGASQVTAVVARAQSADAPRPEKPYEVALRAHLIPPYFIRLRDPVAIPTPTDWGQNWMAAVRILWAQKPGKPGHASHPAEQIPLLPRQESA